MRISAVGTALPPNCYDQQSILAVLQRIWHADANVQQKLASLHEHALVQKRHLALPLASYERLQSFGESNDAWIRIAKELGEHAIRQALDRAGLGPRDIDALYVTSVTGIASPSLDAQLINRMELRNDVKRLPLFGLGCVGGVAGLARAAEYVRAFPEQVAVLLAVELCSLTIQKDDVSLANLISTGLFGDGAAAVVISGAARAAQGPRADHGPRVVASRSVFYPGTEDLMGWNITEKGFRIVLSPRVPGVAKQVARDVDAFLAEHGLKRRDIAQWICHPGGPKVLQALQQGLGLSDDAVALAWRMLAEQGNLSSASVLMVLDATLRERAPVSGSYGLMLAMGPGFCSELLLLRF